MNEALRQSGRTTRLLEQACRAAESGRAVYIFMVNTEMANRFKQGVERAWNVPGRDTRKAHGIKVESMRYWDDHRQWDWENMRPSYGNYHPNCLFLVDHTVVEQRIEQINKEIKYLATLAGKLYPHTV